MRSFLSASRSQSFLRLSVVALLGGSAAACSSDVARFNDPNASPFASQAAPTYTGSVAAAPSGQVQRAPMTAPAPQVASAPYGAPAYPAPYGAPAAPAPVAAAPNYSTTPYVSPNYAAVVPSQNQQPLYGAQPAAPQQLAVAAPTARAATPSVVAQTTPAHAAAPVRAAAAGSSHVVTSGQTLSSLSRQYGVPRGALAAANGLDINAPVQIGQSITIPAGGTAAPVVAAAPKPAATPVKPAPTLAAAPTTAVTPVAAQASKTTAVASAPIAAPTEPKAQTIAAVKASETPDDVRADSGVQFRWPVRGRVISGFGPKPGGQQNEGINISVPEGTSVKAAEDGVVAYAGSELKGYGNLVLIKHADGWVTAYANNSALDVKKGDTVKRGQVIAKAGQTGNVNTPQVHFEIRKGSQPVDPSQHLAGL